MRPILCMNFFFGHFPLHEFFFVFSPPPPPPPITFLMVRPLHGTVWNRSRCLHGTFLEPVRIGSNTGPAKQQVQFWIRSGPVPGRSLVNRGLSVRFSDRILLEPVPCKHSPRKVGKTYATPLAIHQINQNLDAKN